MPACDERVFSVVTSDDLQEIRQLALAELNRFLNRAGSPPGKYHSYQSRLVAVCLVQGTAQHFVDCTSPDSFDNEICICDSVIEQKGYQVMADGMIIAGIKDIDVTFFFEHDHDCPIPSIGHCRKSIISRLRSIGPKKLDFLKKGVRMDVLMCASGSDPEAVIRAYIQSTRHGKDYLSQQSVIGLYPDTILAKVLWATKRVRRTPIGAASEDTPLANQSKGMSAQ